METRDPTPKPENLVSQDEGGVWVNMNSHCVSSHHTESLPAASGERLHDETKVIPAAPAVITKYYSVMDDEGADDVFIPQVLPPPPPCSMSPLLPAEGSTGATASNSSVTPSNGATDATEAKANPSSLDQHHSEKQLMAAQTEEDEVKTNIVQTSKESVDNVLLSSDKDAAPPACESQTHMDETSWVMEIDQEEAGIQYRDDATGNEESNAKPEDTVISSEGRGSCAETDAEKDNYPKQIPSNREETCEYETCLSKKVDEPKYDNTLNERDSNMTENLDRESLEINTPPQSGLSVNDDDFESSEQSELCKYNQSRTGAETNQTQLPDFSAGVTSDDREHVDSRSLDYNLTRNDWVRRESGSAEMQVAQVASEESEDRSRRISNDILQGEQLLQRLQLLQQRHDVHLPEGSQTTEQVVKETRGEGMGGIEVEDSTVRGRKSTDEEGKEEHRFYTVKEEKEKTYLTEKEENESKNVQTKVRTSSSSTSGQPEHQRQARTEPSDSEEDERESWVPSDLSPTDPHEKAASEIEFLSSGHRFSAAETSIEKQMHEAVQRKQNLQRAGGIFNLAENPDVLEIPFKTNVSLESFANKDGASQSNDWQFSEQKMKKEISQATQRELVLVNQGKIPGEYSKGEIRELKETKLMFEAFQQDNAEGPTRHQKQPTPVVKGHVYPSVLERTRSLEMLTLKSCPVSRAHSFRQYNSATSEREKSPENFRSKSPVVASRDKTRLSPYSKQDKHLRLHRSMDSINSDMSALAADARGKAREGKARKESPILKHNPFFKLRPALALQPEVEKDIREAKEREEELRKQRCTLYGLSSQQSEDEEKSWCTQTLIPDVRKLSCGKLERVWPPPSKKDQMKPDQTQQEAKVHRAGGQKAPLWQRWESGQINGQSSQEDQ